MNGGGHRRDARPTGRSRWMVAAVVASAVVIAACGSGDDATDAPESADTSIEFRDERGPHVDDPDRAMAMTVDAVELAEDDILVRLRVSNSDDRYLDMGVEDTLYGPLLVMRDDRANRYESYAVEPAGIPGERVADLSFRLAGPLQAGATSFTLELATQRGPLTSPSATLPRRNGVHWRVDDPAGTPSDDPEPVEAAPVFAAPPRLPDLVHFWLESAPLTPVP